MHPENVGAWVESVSGVVTYSDLRLWRMAATVASISDSVWAVEMKPVSKGEGAV